MEILKDEVVLRIKSHFRTNVLHHLGSNNLPGIACKSVESMIKFCRFHLIVYFIIKEDKQYQRDVIACIFDDVIPDLKNELTLFMKETKLDTKKQEEVDKINKKRSTTKSKPKIIPPPIIDSSSKPIFISPPIIDSSIDKFTVTNLNKNNNNELVMKRPLMKTTTIIIIMLMLIRKNQLLMRLMMSLAATIRIQNLITVMMMVTKTRKMIRLIEHLLMNLLMSVAATIMSVM